MIRHLKHIIALLLVGLLLLPSVVKLEHHHEHFECHATSQKHLHTHHAPCAVCSFEFSAFTPQFFFFLVLLGVLFLAKIRILRSAAPLVRNCFCFLLRAPPVA